MLSFLKQQQQQKNNASSTSIKDKILALISDVIQVVESSPQGSQLVTTTAVPADLSTPNPAEFVILEAAEEEPRETDVLKRSSRRLRRRSNVESAAVSNGSADAASSALVASAETKPKQVVKISISNKYLSGTYSERIGETIYPFYNDLRIAYMHTIKEYPIGCKSYIFLSDIFKFTVDLILREGVRLSLLTPDEVVATDEDQTESSEVSEQMLESLEEEYENEILKGFQKVYSDVVEQYGEAFVVYTKNGPLFTSLNGKSSLDNRDTIALRPNNVANSVSTTRILPQISPMTNYQMAFISPIISSVPHPSIPPTVLLSGFTHPNSMPHPVPKYLQYQETQSFSPCSDASNSLLDKDLVDSLWYETISQRRMVTEQEMLKILGEKKDDDVEMTDAPSEETSTEPKDTENNKVTENGSSSKDKPNDELLEENDNDDIDFTQALLWSPTHFIDDDELEAAQNGTEVELISELILELQRLQNQRLAKNDETEFLVSMEERRLASKIQNGLARILELDGITPQQLGLDLDPKYPVLQAVYQGTLPVPELQQPKYPGLNIGGPNAIGAVKHGRYAHVRRRR